MLSLLQFLVSLLLPIQKILMSPHCSQLKIRTPLDSIQSPSVSCVHFLAKRHALPSFTVPPMNHTELAGSFSRCRSLLLLLDVFFCLAYSPPLLCLLSTTCSSLSISYNPSHGTLDRSLRHLFSFCFSDNFVYSSSVVILPCLHVSVPYSGLREFLKGEVSFISIFMTSSPNIGT